VNPARLDYVHANDTCIQCHSQGQPLKNPVDGKYYDWPVGFHVGLSLSDFWKLEDHKLGETTFTHFADGTAHKNRMQGNDCHVAGARERRMLDLPWAELAERAAYCDSRAAHTSCGRQYRQPMRRLPYAQG
jgi:hypothetical protein